MKTPLLLITVASFSLSGIVLAQEPAAEPKGKMGPKPPGACSMGKERWGGGAPGAGKGGEMFSRMLQLTPEQKEKVKAIWEAQKPKIQAIRDEERVKMKAIFEDVDKQMRPLLTAEQVAVFDNAKKLRESQMALRKDQAPAKSP